MIDRLNKAEFSASPHLRTNTPAIITDGLSTWPEQGRWSVAMLLSTVKDKPVKVCISADRRFNWKPSRDREGIKEFSQREMSFSEAAQLIEQPGVGPQLYVMQQSLQEKFPELLPHIEVPEWIARERPIKTNLWFGGSSATQLHYDGQNNFFAQLHGNKQFTLFAPRDTRNLYPYPLDSRFPHASHVDPDEPDVQRHPQFLQAEPIRFSVQPGELLFLPAFWWHRVKACGTSISINFWWPASLAQYLAAPNSFRNLYQLYETDRLQALQRVSLAPRGHDTWSAAVWLLEHDACWGAGILALAALDQVIGRLCAAIGLPRATGCSLRDLPDELAALGPRLQESYDVARSFEMATRVALQVEQGAGPQASANDVRELLTLTRRLDSETAEAVTPDSVGSQ